MMDIHTHILPQVDDGSTSIQMTHVMLQEAKRAGISCIIATPHFRSLKIDREKILSTFNQVQYEAYQYGIQMQLGFEVHYSMLPHLNMQSVADWCVQGTNIVLLEFSNTVRPARWDVMVCDLVQNGYKPIIVHPERYVYIQKSLDMAMELKQYGCELQVDAMALRKRFTFGNGEWKTANKLVHSGMANYIASDAHRPEHYRCFCKVYKKYSRQWPDSGILHNLFDH